MRFWLRYRGHPEVEVTITHERLTLGAVLSRPPSCRFGRATTSTAPDPRGNLEVPLHRRRSDRA
jgi:hypothetical protein